MKKRRQNRKKYRIKNKKLFLSAVIAGIVVIVLIIIAAVNIITWIANSVHDGSEPAKAKTATEATELKETEATEPEFVPEVTIEKSGDYVDIDRLMIVNKHNGLDKDYVPKDLILPNSRAGGNQSRQYMTREAADAMNAMTAGAADDGCTIKVVSGYRDYDYQASLFSRYSNKEGEAKAETYSARAGFSEHQSGLCADVSSPSVGYNLSYSYDETKEGKWLADNCWKYGFIIRYPEGKTDITGYVYEPWHVRYIGQEDAAKMKDSGLTFEEYTGNEPAPDYK